MKKKLLLVFLLIFTLFTAAGCGLFGGGGDENEEKYEGLEYLASPVNLKIKNKVLSWDAVENATKYEVYVNGKKKATVSETSYDFGSQKGDFLTFYVIAVGPDYSNSAKSLTIAYHADIATVAAGILGAAEELEWNFDEDFARELAKRGVTAEKFALEAAAIDALTTALENDEQIENADDLKELLDEFLDADIDLEPYVSALLLALRPSLEDSYDRATSPQEKEMLGEILELYDAEYENLVLAVANAIEYAFDVYTALSEDFFGLLDELKDSNGVEDAETLFAIKDEIVDAFLDTLPSRRDLALVYRIFAKAIEMIVDENELSELFYDSATQFANMNVLQFELFFKLLEEFDLDFYNDALEITETQTSKELAEIEVFVLVLKKVDDFLDENEELVNEIDAALTAEQKEKLMLSMLRLQYELLENMYGVEIEFDEELYLDFVAVMNLLGEKAFDYIIESDGALLLLSAELAGFEIHYDYYDHTSYYFNDVTNEAYDYYNEWAYARDLVSVDYLAELANAYKATVVELSDEQILAIIDYFMANFEMAWSLDEYQDETFVEVITSFVGLATENLGDLRALFDELLAHAEETGFFAGLKATLTQIHEHYVDEFGPDYQGDEDNHDYEENTMIIFLAKFLEPFYTDNETKIEEFIDIFFDRFAELAEEGLIDATVEEVEEIRSELEAWVEDALDYFAEFKTYDPDNLTPNQKDRLSEFRSNPL